MGALGRFLLAAASLAKKGVKESEVLEFAKREFGEVSQLMKAQIRKLYKNKDAPSIKNPAKQEGEVVPFKKDQASGSIMDQVDESMGKIEGASNRITKIQKEIDAMYKPKPETSPLMSRLDEGIKTLKTMKRPGMDLATGLTRTSVRKILEKNGIQIPDKTDPIEVFATNFGADALIDVKNVAEEMLELEQMGKVTKSIDEVLQQEGMFDIPINKDAPKGMSQDELRQIKKEVDQEKIFKDFDPTNREPNSIGGINRTRYVFGGGIKLAKFFKDKGTTLAAEIRKAVDNIFASGDSKYDADVAVDSALEEFGVDREMFDQMDIIDAYDEAYQTIVTQRGLASGKIPGSKPIKQGDEITSENFRDSQFAPDTSELEKARELAPKMVERFELKERFPGIDEELLTDIIEDPNPQHKAEVIATLDETFKMMQTGKGPEEIIDILEQGKKTRKDNAQGGLNYLMGL
jgi:hypothetical protein